MSVRKTCMPRGQAGIEGEPGVVAYSAIAVGNDSFTANGQITDVYLYTNQAGGFASTNRAYIENPTPNSSGVSINSGGIYMITLSTFQTEAGNSRFEVYVNGASVALNMNASTGDFTFANTIITLNSGDYVSLLVHANSEAVFINTKLTLTCMMVP